jgi:hypothetical protein
VLLSQSAADTYCAVQLTIWKAPTIFCKLGGKSVTFCVVLSATQCS